MRARASIATVMLALTVPVALASAVACSTLLSVDDEADPVTRDAAQADTSSQGNDGDVVPNDGAVPPNDAQQPDAARAKIVFVTKAKEMGDLGGIAGADALCTAEARSSGLAGTFVAYLHRGGGDSGHPRYRLPDAGGWSRSDGVPAFLTRAGPPSVPLVLTSDAATIDASEGAWTGITIGVTQHCGVDGGVWNTTDTSPFSSATGNPARTDDNWSMGGVSACSVRHHIYCFEL